MKQDSENAGSIIQTVRGVMFEHESLEKARERNKQDFERIARKIAGLPIGPRTEIVRGVTKVDPIAGHRLKKFIEEEESAGSKAGQAS